MRTVRATQLAARFANKLLMVIVEFRERCGLPRSEPRVEE
jgi:hypothetical protein